MTNTPVARTALWTTLIALSLAAPLGVLAGNAGHGDGHRMHRHGMLAALDQNKDGQISRDEASRAHHDRLATIDADADGTVTFEEMQAFREAERERRQRARFSRMDADQDGAVSVAELADRADARFERMDRDADGMISRDEFRMNHPHRRARHDAD